MREIEVEKAASELREVVELGQQIAAAIKKTSPYPEEGIKTVVRIVYRELRRAGFTSMQVLKISNVIMQCVTDEMKKGR